MTRARQRVLLGAGRATVAVAVADLMSQPAQDAALDDQALLGDTLKVLGAAAADYVQVETAAAYRGFVHIDDLWPLPGPLPGPLPVDAPEYGSGQVVFVIARFANVYGQPDVEARNPILVAPMGARLRLASERRDDGPDDRIGRWLSIVLPDGRQAFVQRGDVSAESGGFTAACVTDHALRHEGTPYLWGGRSTYGIDCSGLVSNAYGACGVLPPRNAALQYDWRDVTPVEAGALLPGDLIFFGTYDRGKPLINHVGIYLGHDRFVHATTWERPTVHVSTLSDPHWQGLLIGLRHHPALRQAN